jgi:MFS superfamily sulfate permease-like transporter
LQKALVILVTQLIPILGLTPFEKRSADATTFSRLKFVLDNVWEHGHRLTIMISMTTLGALVLIRMMKKFLQPKRGFGWVFYIPEVFIVLVMTTGKSP